MYWQVATAVKRATQHSKQHKAMMQWQAVVVALARVQWPQKQIKNHFTKKQQSSSSQQQWQQQ